MTEEPLNPYSPPSEADTVDSPVAKSGRRNYLLEAVQAFVTIFGIMIGWAFVAIGDLWGTIIGLMIMAVSCVIGLGGVRKRKQRD